MEKMGTPPLSSETEQRIGLLFAPVHCEIVRTILLDEFGNNLPFLGNLDWPAMDRFRFAVLKLSGGSLDRLRDAV